MCDFEKQFKRECPFIFALIKRIRRCQTKSENRRHTTIFYDETNREILVLHSQVWTGQAYRFSEDYWLTIVACHDKRAELYNEYDDEAFHQRLCAYIESQKAPQAQFCATGR